jgi:hypothetical protein
VDVLRINDVEPSGFTATALDGYFSESNNFQPTWNDSRDDTIQIPTEIDLLRYRSICVLTGEHFHVTYKTATLRASLMP